MRSPSAAIASITKINGNARPNPSAANGGKPSFASKLAAKIGVHKTAMTIPLFALKRRLSATDHRTQDGRDVRAKLRFRALDICERGAMSSSAEQARTGAC